MHFSTLLAIAIVSAGVAASSAQTKVRDCVVTVAEREAMLRQDYQTFDEAADANSWRNLLQRGCVREAVAILQAYGRQNGSRLTRDQRLELNFHIGQTLAFGGYDAESLPYFESARADGASAEWNAYVDATVAFLRKDRAGLEDAKRRYAAAPAAQPMRVKIIDGFLKCLEKTYAEAVHCAFDRDMR